MPISDIMVPFDENGNMLDYVDDYHRLVKEAGDKAEYQFPQWRGGERNLALKRNYVFADTLTYHHYSRGRSSAKIIFIGLSGLQYEMFLTDFHDMMESVGLNQNRVTGTFTFCKRGLNFGIKLAK